MKKIYDIFLVEDDELYKRLIENAIRRHVNVTIRSFSVGEICLRNMDLNPDIVILDHNLDGTYQDALSGLDILKTIKRDYPKVQVILLSGQDDLEVAVEALHSGAKDYIVKNKTAFIRLENSINAIIKENSSKNDLKLFKQSVVILSLLFALLLFIFVCLQITFPAWFKV
jgi:two-component system OmpR family response regulator